MLELTMVVGWCIIVVTAISIYFPIVYIRKTNKLLKKLEEIEANTRKPQA
jgi:hypothetical protein